MAEPNEVVDLIVALALMPIVLSGARGVDARLRRVITVFIVCLLVALGATIAEGFVMREAFNILEHAMYALAGVLAAIGTVAAWRGGGTWSR